MVILKTNGDMIAPVKIVNVVRGKLEVWLKDSDEPIYLKISEVQCIS